MTVTALKIVPIIQLTNVSLPYGSVVPANSTQIIKSAVFSNTGSVPRQINVNIVPTGKTASVANQIVNARTLLAGKTIALPELVGYEMITGDQIFASASASIDVNMTINGTQIS